VSHASTLEERVVDLELRYMRQEKLVDDLNEVVVAQGRTIDRLVAEVKSLREQIAAGVDALPKDERPPHY
jgi:SlyX protein